MPEESLPNKSNLPIKLVIRSKSFEVTTEGTIASIANEIDSLVDFIKSIREQLEPEEKTIPTSTEEEPIITEAEIAKAPTAEIPSIKATKSTSANLEALFETSWGRTPHTIAEIMKALEVNAIPDVPTSVQPVLINLIQKGKIRRIKDQGKYVYFKLPE
ncbi:MAG: hypothetical protein ABSB71_09485 [Candidatus Bathyarchaeia archaeon]|jgi:phage gp29-like protein